MNDWDNDDLQVDLTPLIDVTFMLVIFFIMTMSFALPSIELDLPRSETAQRQAEQTASLRINVSADGAMFHQDRPISLDEAAALLKQGSFKLIELNLDQKAPAQRLIDAADLARLYTEGRLQVNTFIKEDLPEQK